MDDIVRLAMAKWPNVPACYGWLGLDARGNWWMRDERAQAVGDYASGAPGAKGSRLQHDKLIDFIARNYAQDAAGCSYFQNGPQRVYVELEVSPWIWRIEPDDSVRAHTGEPAQVIDSEMDEAGWLYLRTNLGFGLVHTQDVEHAAGLVERGVWAPIEVRRDGLATRHGYVLSPQRDRRAAAQHG